MKLLVGIHDIFVNLVGRQDLFALKDLANTAHIG